MDLNLQVTIEDIEAWLELNQLVASDHVKMTLVKLINGDIDRHLLAKYMKELEV